jgi:hypothetical protein
VGAKNTIFHFRSPSFARGTLKSGCVSMPPYHQIPPRGGATVFFGPMRTTCSPDERRYRTAVHDLHALCFLKSNHYYCNG